MIIKRIIESKENIFYVENGRDYKNNKTKPLHFNKNKAELNSLELSTIEIINLLESTKGIDIEHFIFDYKNDYCVFIYEKNNKLNKVLSEIEKYPIIRDLISDYETQYTEYVNHTDDVRLIGCLRLSENKDKFFDSQSTLIVYSFKNSAQRDVNHDFSLDNPYNEEDYRKSVLMSAFLHGGEYLTYDYVNNLIFFCNFSQISAFSYYGDHISNHSNDQIKSKTFKYALKAFEWGYEPEYFNDYEFSANYYPNGNLASICSHNLIGDNHRIGNFAAYYPDGSINVKGSYTNNGGKIGVWEEYYKNGQLKLKGEYKSFGGGMYYDEIWDEKTNQFGGGMFPNGDWTAKDGKWIEYYESGIIKSKESYTNGNLIDKQEYDELDIF